MPDELMSRFPGAKVRPAARSPAPEREPERAPEPGPEPDTERFRLGAEADREITRLLALARHRLDMEVCWLSRLCHGDQIVEAVNGDAASFGMHVGDVTPTVGTICAQVLNGRVPPVVSDVRHDPRTASLPITTARDVGAYIGAPVVLPDGHIYGMICALSHHADPGLRDRDGRFLALLADVVSDTVRGLHRDRHERALTRERIFEVIESGGPSVVFQPVYDITRLELRGAEALSRFPPGFGGPDRWFSDAHLVGLGVELELASVRAALRAQPDFAPGLGIGVNASPRTVLREEFHGALAAARADLVIIEITEHDDIVDYPAVLRALSGLRRLGVRIAVDDLGAGYAGLLHVVHLHPDFIKMDRVLIQGIDVDPSRRALAAAIVHFADSIGSRVVAEGVETAREFAAVTRAGIHQAQGRYLAPPGPLPLPSKPVHRPPMITDSTVG